MGAPQKSKWRCLLCSLTPPKVKRRGSRSAICENCRDRLGSMGLAWCSRCLCRHEIEAMAAGRGWCRDSERERNHGAPRDRRAYAKQWRALKPGHLAAYMARPGVRERKIKTDRENRRRQKLQVWKPIFKRGTA